MEHELKTDLKAKGFWLVVSDYALRLFLLAMFVMVSVSVGAIAGSVFAFAIHQLPEWFLMMGANIAGAIAFIVFGYLLLVRRWLKLIV